MQDLNNNYTYEKDEENYLVEEDYSLFFDSRTWESNIEDIEGGDNFADFCEEFFELLDEEEYFEN